MRPRALKANKTLTPLVAPELLLLELELVALGVGVEEVAVEAGYEEVKVTPYDE